MRKKTLAWLLTLTMLLSLFTFTSFGVFAEEEGEQDLVVTEESPAVEPADPEETAAPEVVPEAAEEEQSPAVTEESPAAEKAAPAAATKKKDGSAAKAKADPGNPPAEISTVDSRADGITINLFDYDLTDDAYSGDTWNNYPTAPTYAPFHGGWPEAGINQGHNLKFFGHGGAPILEGNSNLYTGEPTARQGIVDAVLGEDGYPVLTDFGGQDSLAYLFDTNGSAYKTVYSDVNHLFQLDSQENYVYNSDNNYAYYDPSQGSSGDFAVYDGTYMVDESVWDGTITGNKMPVGFFPFDEWNENKTSVSPALETEDPYNHQVGLSMECDLFIPESGKVDGDDLIFRFSGDDDAWLFIDDVLIMDVGGLHLPLGGYVNFTTGEVTVDSAVDVVPYASDAKIIETMGTENTLSAIFEAAGKEWDPAAPHHMKFFYLERGGCYSNLALATNVWKATGVRMNVEKVWKDDKDHSNDEVKVDLYADGEKVEGKTLTLSADNDWTDTFNALPVYNDDGEPIVYTVKEQNVDDYDATYEKGGKVVKEKTYWVAVDAADLEDGETYAITAPDWMNGNATRIFTGTDGLIETVGADTRDRAVPGENQQLVDDEGSYTQILKSTPTADQLFVATKLDTNGEESGTFWRFSNGAGNLTLVGNYHWWDNTYGYWYTMTTTSTWDGTNNYQNALSVDPESGGTAVVSGVQFWGNQWGGLDRGADQYIYLTDQNGTYPSATHPDPIWNRDWCAHITFWKQVTVEETTELPDDWTITNSPAGDLVVSKTVEGTASQKKQDFTFVVTLDDDSISGTYGDMTFTNGVAMFTLSDGESMTAEDLPDGISYTVIEAAGEDYKATFEGDTGTIAAGEDATAAFTNTFEKSDSEGSGQDQDTQPGTGDGTDLPTAMLLLLASGAVLGLLARRRQQG